MNNQAKNTAAKNTVNTKKKQSNDIPLTPGMVSQTASYREGDKCEPDNNRFFEERSNPLSSKGN